MDFVGCTVENGDGPAQRGGLPLVLETERNLDLGRLVATQESVDEYLRSVGDALPIYKETGLAPPMYAAASALGSLLRQLALPPGAIHSLQEVKTLTPVAIGSEIKVSAFLEKPRRRAGLEFITVVCTVESGGAVALTSKSTVLVPSGESSEGRPAPYFSATYLMTCSRPRIQKSTSMSGIDTRSGFRKRSKMIP